MHTLEAEVRALRSDVRTLQKSVTNLVKERERELNEEATWEVRVFSIHC